MSSNLEAGNAYSYVSEQEVFNVGIYASQIIQEQKFQEELNEKKMQFDMTFGDKIALCKELFKTSRLY